MGYIDTAGKYHRGQPKMDRLVPSPTKVWKQSDHDRQRRDYKRDLIRPYNPDGTPNQDFIEAFPVESREAYKFIPTDEQLSKEV